MPTWIGIALGDVTGIGPEVTLKALAAELERDDARYLIIGDMGCLRRLNARLRLPLRRFTGYTMEGRIGVLTLTTTQLPAHLPPGSPVAARGAVAWLREGGRRCLSRELAALVTAPVNKEAIARAGFPFVGQTEFFAKLAGTRRVAMMLVGSDDRGHELRVALVTTHLALRRVASVVTRERVLQTIELAVRACHDLGLARARIGVCGLNPHAGEGGTFGTEEITVIRPAVEAALSLGCEVRGPLPADTLFHHAYRGDYDAVVAMYHDQGLAPLKTIAFERGVNWTLGLPFIRTSPDHGTAYDLAGRNQADPASMLEAIRLAKRLARRCQPGL